MMYSRFIGWYLRLSVTVRRWINKRVRVIDVEEASVDGEYGKRGFAGRAARLRFCGADGHLESGE